jgi:hypothetical protein
MPVSTLTNYPDKTPSYISVQLTKSQSGTSLNADRTVWQVEPPCFADDGELLILSTRSRPFAELYWSLVVHDGTKHISSGV